MTPACQAAWDTSVIPRRSTPGDYYAAGWEAALASLAPTEPVQSVPLADLPPLGPNCRNCGNPIGYSSLYGWRHRGQTECKTPERIEAPHLWSEAELRALNDERLTYYGHDT